MKSTDAHLYQLESWFSRARMSSFSSCRNPSAMYVWNTRLTKAFLEDIQHVEVLLRNRIDDAMSAEVGTDWMTAVHFYCPPGAASQGGADRKYSNNILRAQQRAGGNSASKGKVIAELSFDHWRFLLTSKKEVHIWRHLRKHLPAYSLHGKPRQPFEDAVIDVLRLRNRCAHHEPIGGSNLQNQKDRITKWAENLQQLASWIDPEAATWIHANSRVKKVWSQRPVNTWKEYLWLLRNPIP